jgi:hypothetical protein
MTDIQCLADRLAIRDVLHLYCRAYDRFDRELALTGVFDAEGRAHYPGLPELPAAELVDATLAGNRGYTATSHQITSALIEVDGDSATSEAYGIARALEETDGAVVEHNWSTRYLDRWRRGAAGWRILHRRTLVDCYTVAATGSVPILIPGLDPGLTPRPGRADPVYDFAK